MSTVPQPARLRDVPGLLAVMWAFTRHTPWLPMVRPWYVDAWLMLGLVRAGQVHLLRDTQGVLAFIARSGGRVLALYVRPAARGQGHGRRLLAAAQGQGDALELWTQAANAPARAFYAALGFAEVGQGNGQGNDEGLPDIHLVWGHRGAR